MSTLTEPAQQTTAAQRDGQRRAAGRRSEGALGDPLLDVVVSSGLGASGGPEDAWRPGRSRGLRAGATPTGQNVLTAAVAAPSGGAVVSRSAEGRGRRPLLRPIVQPAGGSPLADPLRVRAEQALSHDFSHVRVHSGGEASALARSIQARAFTMGSHIWIGGGSVAAAGRSQDELLLHELVHVKQHDEGRLSGVSGEISHPTDPHEQEAERSARQAVVTLSSLTPPAEPIVSAGTPPPSSASGPISRGILDDVRAAGAEIADLGGDAFMALARSLSPTLARLIEEGPGPLLREQVLPALEGWARALLGDLDPLGAVTRLQESLGGALALLGGALTGDPACCTALATLVDAVREMAQSLMESPIVQELQQLYGALSAKLALMIRVVAEPVFEAVKDTLGEAWGKVTGLADTVKGWMAEAQSWIGGAYDWLLEKLGLPPGGGEGGVRGWLMGHMNELWAEVQERLGPLAGPVKVLAAAAVALSPMGSLVALVTFGPQLIEIVSWLWAHKDDPDIVASAHEELGHTMLPGLLDGITQLRTILGAANEWLSGMFQAVNDAVNDVLGAIAELPLVKAAREGFDALSAMADSAIQWVKDTFGPTVTQAQEMASAAMEWARPIIEVAISIPQALYPPNIPKLLVGWGWRMMPDCYKGPIIDLLLDAAIVFLSALPVIPGLNDLWPLFRPGVLGFLKGVKSQTLEVKIAVSDKIAKLLTGASLSLALGFVKGLLLGLWEGLTDPFKLLWSLGSGMVSVVGWLWRQATSVVATVTQGTNHDAGAPSAGAKTTLAQSAQALRPPAETIAQNAIPAATHAMSSGEGMTFDGLIEWISGLWSSAQSAIASAGGSLADGLCKWFSSDGAESQIGESIGWLVGTILFEVALAVLTAGSWVAVGPTMQLLLRLLDWPGEVLGVMAKVLGKLGGALFAVAQKIGGMFAKADGPLKRVLDALFELGAALRRAADGLFGKVLGRNGDEVLERGAREVGEELGEQGVKHADEVVERGAREAGEELGEQGAKHVDDVPDLAAKRVVAAEATVVMHALDAAGQPVQAILLALRAAFMPVHPWIRNFIARPSGRDWRVYLLGSELPLSGKVKGLPKGPSADGVGDEALERGAREAGEELGEQGGKHVDAEVTPKPAMGAEELEAKLRALPETVDPRAIEQANEMGMNVTSTQLPSITEQASYVSEHVQGLTVEQAERLIEMARNRKGTLVFGGSRVRGTARLDAGGQVISDIDLGFKGMSKGQINTIKNNFNKAVTGSSQGPDLPIEHNWIYPGSQPLNIPAVVSPEEFFMRSGIRDPSPKAGPYAGEPFGPSGFVFVASDGRVVVVKP